MPADQKYHTETDMSYYYRILPPARAASSRRSQSKVISHNTVRHFDRLVNIIKEARRDKKAASIINKYY
jgi:hypothetical protein